MKQAPLKSAPLPKRSVKETLLLQLTAIICLAVTPFTLVSLLERQWPVALLDISIVSVTLSLFLYVYFTRKTQLAAVAVALIFLSGALTSVYLQGLSEVYWVFPAIAAAFFLLERRYAAPLCLFAIGSVVIALWGVESTRVLANISLTLITTVVIAYSFSRATVHRRTELRELARIDPLTGAGNRRAQDEKLDTVNASSRRTRLPCSVLLLDVDHFKSINDNHGHAIGDRILVELSDLIRRSSRATESLYRYGGEEFVLIAEHTRLEEAALFAERLRRIIEQHAFPWGIRITVSIGVADLHLGEGRQGWLSRADNALYQAKQGGRNRTVLAEPPSDVSSSADLSPAANSV